MKKLKIYEEVVARSNSSKAALMNEEQFKNDVVKLKSDHTNLNVYDYPEGSSDQPHEELEEVYGDDILEQLNILIENYYLVRSPNGNMSGWIKKPIEYISVDKRAILHDCKLADKTEGITFSLGDHGQVLDSFPTNLADLDFVPQLLPKSDVFGDDIQYKEDKYLMKKKKEDKVFVGKTTVNFGVLSSVKENMNNFRSLISSGALPDSEGPIDKLIRIAFTQPSQFDETFTVEVDKPESPLMRKYLSTLANLVNESLSTLEDDGIEDMKLLQEEAYKQAGYIGKTLDVVIQEAMDYGAHFRFLLLKGERTVLEEKWKDYFTILLKEIDEYSFKRKPAVGQVYECLPCSNVFAIKEFIPQIKIVKDKISITFFTYVDSIYEVNEHFNLELSTKIGLISELVKTEYSNEVGKAMEVFPSILICDRNANISQFEVRKQTLAKWIKFAQELIMQAEFAFKDKKAQRFRKIDTMI